MVNQPTIEQIDLDNIIYENILCLTARLNKLGFKDITREDIRYNFLDRCEDLYIESAKIYPDLDVPDKFGVHRDYAGGGIHSGLISTEIDRLPKNRQAKAGRALDAFKHFFWATLKDIEKISAQNENVTEREVWEQVTL